MPGGARCDQFAGKWLVVRAGCPISKGSTRPRCYSSAARFGADARAAAGAPSCPLSASGLARAETPGPPPAGRFLWPPAQPETAAIECAHLLSMLIRDLGEDSGCGGFRFGSPDCAAQADWSALDRRQDQYPTCRDRGLSKLTDARAKSKL